MHVLYSSSATPVSAFLEGMVRMFDWGAMWIAIRKKKNQRWFFPERDAAHRQWIIDRYITDSISRFEVEEADKLSDAPFIPRRRNVAASVALGAMPAEEVIVQYEKRVPGAVERIMGQASDSLEHDSEAEFKHIESLIRQGFKGMVAGLAVAVMLAVAALALLFTNFLWPGVILMGVNGGLGLCSTLYVTRTGLRQRWFTGEFFPRIVFPRRRYRLQNIGIGGQKHDIGKSR